MPFQLSPGVVVTETDLTTIVPAVATSIGGFVGNFQWGPALEIRTIDSENKLVQIFGGPTANTATSFFSAANFLSYSNNLKVVRVVGTAARNAMGNLDGNAAAVLVPNEDFYNANYPSGSTALGEFVAKYPGTIGNSIRYSVADANTYTTWLYANLFTSAPATSDYASLRSGVRDELHVVVVDADGKLTGTAGTVLETFPFLSKASDAKKVDGSTGYYKDVLNSASKYLWWMRHPTLGTNWGAQAAGVTFANLASNVTVTMSGGVESRPVDANLMAGYAMFGNDEAVDVNLLIGGEANATVSNYMIQNICEVRKDCVAFVSPPLTTVVNNANQEATSIVTYRNTLTSSSYGVLDSGWKYQYDRYNDTYRWIPLNGDIAGLAARTDQTNDPWWSPAGLNRGIIKNVVKLAYSPARTDRDTLYSKGINPIVSFPGQGTVMYGDKTMLSRPSAFDRINVRRLFIVLEKAIATAAKYSLFEFNDAFTRAQFVNLVEP